jgi:putative ABC transport system permease protein
MLGYAIAVAFLIVAFSLTEGYNVVATGELRGIGTHFVAYVPASRECPCQGAEVGPFFKDVYTPTFSYSLIDAVKGLSGVEDAAPCLMFRLDNYTICGIEVDTLATETNTVAQDEVVKGRFLEAGVSDGIMLDQVFADMGNLTVGDRIACFGRPLFVVGIVNPSLHSKPAGIAQMYAPISVVQDIARYYGELYNFGVGDANVVLVEISPRGDENYLNSVEKNVLETVETYAGQKGAIVGYQCGLSARKVVSITESGALAISIVLLACATLFSLKSQFGSVIERTREIGILKALGWTDLDVTKQVFCESFLQGLLGGIAGVCSGYFIIFLIPHLGLISLQNLMLSVSPTIVLGGFLVALFGGVFAGIFPSWRAAKLQPTEALRSL